MPYTWIDLGWWWHQPGNKFKGKQGVPQHQLGSRSTVEEKSDSNLLPKKGKKRERLIFLTSLESVMDHFLVRNDPFSSFPILLLL